MQYSSDRKIYSRRFKIKQTNILLQSDFEPSFELANQAIRYNRSLIETYISQNPDFLSSFHPVEVSGNIPIIIKRMVKASNIAGTGPMASIAGAIAEIATETLCKAGASYGVAENGGDISIIGNKPKTIVGIYDGGSKKENDQGLKNFAFKIRNSDLPIGICTSGGNIGHSISLGEADAAVVLSNSATISDAVATSLGNMIDRHDPEGSIQKTLEIAEQIREINGCMIIVHDIIGRVGKLPEFVELENFDRFEFY